MKQFPRYTLLKAPSRIGDDQSTSTTTHTQTQHEGKMPLKLRLLLVAFVGCTVADRSLSFGEPNLVAGEHDGGGPWWDKVS